MRTFAVIGLGTFGSNLARRLYQLGNEVIAIDSDKERVQEMHDACNQAVLVDAADRDAMSAIGLDDVDAAIISLGEGIESSTLATLYLREAGVKQIVVKAVSPDHEKILRSVGATEVVYPERDIALRLADRISAPNVLEYIALSGGFTLVEMKAPKELWGKTLIESNLKQKYGVAIVSIRKVDGTMVTPPGGADRIEDGQTLWAIGAEEAVASFKKLL